MKYNIRPPDSWIKTHEKVKDIDLFLKIMNQYEDSNTLFKLIQKDGNVKELKKDYCIKQIQALSSQIYEKLIKYKKNRQIKIFAVIGSSEESIILMLSSLFLSAHHCICFEDLSEDVIIKRVEIFAPDIILCRKNTEDKVKKAIRKSLYKKTPLLSIDLRFPFVKLISKEYLTKETYSYKTNSNLFTLFTSGSTGLPKAVTHGVKNYIEYAQFTTSYFFGIKKGSTIFTATDAGWINGHTYAFYGPLLLGAKSVFNENPAYLSFPKNLVNCLIKTQPDCFYTSVTLLRLLRSLVPSGKSILDFSEIDISLERVGSCGEPLAHSVGDWAIKFFKPKRTSIVNTYFQTETGGVLVAPRDEDSAPSDYSCVGKPRI
tara:strand:- start:7448 stop:8566 length:1119 start_codon:yes stop_codon:yes gene_type:complete